MAASRKLKNLGLILAGGQSKRLFPMKVPKPLLKVDGKFLLQEALERLKNFDTYIVTNQQIANEIKKAFKKAKLKMPQFIIEPTGRDTAAAVGFGIREASKKKKYSWAAILSADTWMPESKKFSEFLNQVDASIALHPQSLFVGGSLSQTKPEHSHSSFGWVLSNSSESKNEDLSRRVLKFVEKPKGEMLTSLRAQGALINAGMFFGKVETFLSAFKEFYPEVLKATKISYKDLVRLPVDKAIFEKYKSVRVVPLALRWEDLGTWEDWFQHIGEGEAKRVQSERVFVQTSESFEVHAYGVKDLVIIESEGRILVMPLSRARDLKDFLTND
jgi:mannose-1-phosphate guanylyltransferase/mannose-6-phosphate isomerase